MVMKIKCGRLNTFYNRDSCGVSFSCCCACLWHVDLRFLNLSTAFFPPKSALWLDESGSPLPYMDQRIGSTSQDDKKERDVSKEGPRIFVIAALTTAALHDTADNSLL